jgi:hypothetical protein
MTTIEARGMTVQAEENDFVVDDAQLAALGIPCPL